MRTLAYLRAEGYYADIVERFIRNPKLPGGGFRRDFMHFGDILAINNYDTVMVQSCGQSFSQHLKDLLANLNVPIWLACPNRKLMLIGWRKVLKKRGGKQKIWKPRIKEITPEDFNV
jgi:hypothetical protein